MDKVLASEKKVTHKYLKKEQYLFHFQLAQWHYQSLTFNFIINIAVLAFLWIFVRDYPQPLAVLDTTMGILTVLFWVVIKPQMLKGKIPAWYRRDYNRISTPMGIGSVFTYGGLLRFPVVLGVWLLSYKLSGHSPYYLNLIKEMFYSPMYNLLGIALFAFFIYILFYQEKYSPIRDFSNGTCDIVMAQNIRPYDAMQIYINNRDKELELGRIGQVKYDGDFFRKQSKTLPIEIPSKELSEEVPLEAHLKKEDNEVRRKNREIEKPQEEETRRRPRS